MILRIEELKDACSKILGAVDSNSLSTITETLELYSKDKILYLNVTNREYFVQVKIPISEEDDFRATVNANLFLRLISQITSESISITVDDTNLNISGNGSYKLPLIYDGEDLLNLPEIHIDNVTVQFDIKSSILHSIILYNSKEISKGGITRPVQKLYYLDDKGCITFTTGACVNNFDLPTPIKVLLNDRLVKLFKLFKTDSVLFTLGYDPINEDIIQTKVQFENNNIKLTAILSSDSNLLSSVPVAAIRGRASEDYDYSMVINKNEVLEAVSRLLLFADNKISKLYSKFEFSKDSVKIWDTNNCSNEVIFYEKEIASLDETYNTVLDLLDLKITLESCNEQYVNISFGNGQAIVLSRGSVYNIIPECVV